MSLRSFQVIHQQRVVLEGIIVTKLNIILGNLRPPITSAEEYARQSRFVREIMDAKYQF